ncbi:hypothetical protein PBAL39_19085 [Pedobacter sp. BAL39]|uniref:Imm63 family immunity protein n=1 Tax=Pedobacter sp. BAL39 TaxID=391596 RepID=UPI000155AA23|nr:Imm63 family immunity protein [Pedobacter sp. BAL39]EDM34426.1 hypothetical protein PBAL39_19085 [Pedobacter sp. BAL39]
MVNDSLEKLKKKVEELAFKINAPSNLLPEFGREIWNAPRNVQVDGFGFMHYFIFEDCQEIERRITNEIDEILYWIFADVTLSMAINYERHHRVQRQDFRRVRFDKQEELLGKLSQKWKDKEYAEHQRLLTSYPFDDLARPDSRKNFEDFYCHVRNEFSQIGLLNAWTRYDWSLGGNENSFIMSELCMEMAGWVSKGSQTDTKCFMDIIEQYLTDGDIALISMIYTDFLVAIVELKSNERDVIKGMMGVETRTHYQNLLNLYSEND